MYSDDLSDKSYNEKDEENLFAGRQGEENILNKQQQIYDHSFIKSNFCPIKLSRGDIKSLSSDFSDQTLGGHREFREELIDGRLARVYVYKIKIIKYENEVLEVKQQEESDSYNPLIIVENNLIVPFNTSLIQNRQIALNRSPVISPYEQMQMPSGKRGRPRKYPKGEEPYKAKKKMANRCFDEIPDNRFAANPFMRRPGDSNSIFKFGNDDASYEDNYMGGFNSGNQNMPKVDFGSSYQQNERNSFKNYEETPSYKEVQPRNKKTNIDDFLNDYIKGESKDHFKNSNVNKLNNSYPNEYF